MKNVKKFFNWKHSSSMFIGLQGLALAGIATGDITHEIGGVFTILSVGFIVFGTQLRKDV